MCPGSCRGNREECPAGYSAVHRYVHLIQSGEFLAGEDARPEPVTVPVGLEYCEPVRANGQWQALGCHLEDPVRIVLGLHEASSLAQGPGKALGVDGQLSVHRQLGDESRRVERVARCGEHPHSLPAEPGGCDDLVTRLGCQGVEHGRRSQVGADTQSHSEPDQALGDGVVDDAPADPKIG